MHQHTSQPWAPASQLAPASRSAASISQLVSTRRPAAQQQALASASWPQHTLARTWVGEQRRVQLCCDGVAVHARPDKHNLLPAVAEVGGDIEIGQDHFALHKPGGSWEG